MSESSGRLSARAGSHSLAGPQLQPLSTDRISSSGKRQPGLEGLLLIASAPPRLSGIISHTYNLLFMEFIHNKKTIPTTPRSAFYCLTRDCSPAKLTY